MNITNLRRMTLTFGMAVLAVAGCSSDNSAPGSMGASAGGGTVPSSSSGGFTATVGTGGASIDSSSSGGSLVTSSSGGAPVTAGSTGGATSGSSTGGGATVSSSGGMTTGRGGAPAASSGGAGGGGAPMGNAGAGGPSLCPVAGTTICDGFEGAAPGTAGSDFMIDVTAGNTMVVDTTKAYRGTKSMKFSGTSHAYITETKTFMGTTKAVVNNFWGRYFIFGNLTGMAPAAHAVYGTLSGTGTPGDGEFHFVGGSRGKLQAEIRNSGDSYTDSMASPAATDPAFPTPADGWQCWEWHVQPDDSFDFYINGTEVDEMKIVAGKAMKSGASFSPLPIMTKLSIGWQYFGSGMNSGWIDEVALGPNRIGCGS